MYYLRLFFAPAITGISLFVLTATPGYSFERALFYETFEAFDARNGGTILPPGVERVRIGGRQFFTELEIEAPSLTGNTESLARYIPDPTGFSLVGLLIEDHDTALGDGSLGANGSVSLFESILLDQGDHAGQSVVSWMAIPFQSNETGGSLFPETDSRIDAGPEGLNLIGFGGIQRDFDTGEPLMEQDFSGELIFNQSGGADLASIGIGYQAGLPTFFSLVFDLEQSTYEIFINGINVRENIPFFDVGGETGRTLRELELISSVRGLGTFMYDNIFHIDPESPYQPISFRTPLIAENAERIPLFIDEFDDDALGQLRDTQAGDLLGTQLHVTGDISVVEDTSYQTLARVHAQPASSLTCRFPPPADAMDPIRLSFCVTPPTNSVLTITHHETALLEVPAGDTMRLDQDGDGQLDPTTLHVWENLPHWIVLELDPVTGMSSLKLYRAESAQNARTVLLEAIGEYFQANEINQFTFQVEDGSIYLDNIFVTQVNTTPNGTEENRYRALVAEGFESFMPGEHTPYPGTIAADASARSLNVLQTATDTDVFLVEEAGITRSARINWMAIPNQGEVEASVLKLQLHNNEKKEERIIAGFLPGRQIGIDHNGDGQLEAIPRTYPINQPTPFQVILDLRQGRWSLFLHGEPYPTGEGFLLNGASDVMLDGVRLGGRDGGFIQYDDFLVVADHFGATFEPQDYVNPTLPASQALLFEENFENNPARSERQIDELNPRQSGLPIETKSNGFSNKANTDIANTLLPMGAPSADAAYIIDPDGSSLYSLALSDRFHPSTFAGFQSTLPFTPISTLRTIPYAFVAPTWKQAPTKRYVDFIWTGAAMQDTNIGLSFFLQVEDTDIPLPHSSLTAPAPRGHAIVAFGDRGFFLADIDQDGELEDLQKPYNARQSYRFRVRVDRANQEYALYINEDQIVSSNPIFDDFITEGSWKQVGWFTTLVNTGNGKALQQSTVGGGQYIIDDIRILEMEEPTSIRDFLLY